MDLSDALTAKDLLIEGKIPIAGIKPGSIRSKAKRFAQRMGLKARKDPRHGQRVVYSRTELRKALRIA